MESLWKVIAGFHKPDLPNLGDLAFAVRATAAGACQTDCMLINRTHGAAPSRLRGAHRLLSLSVAGAVTMVVIGWPAQAAAQIVSDATRLGSFAGAMRYCEDRYGGSERRYRLARLRVAEALDKMERRDRIRALAARDRAYERGQFLGEPLDRKKCQSLLKISEWKAFTE